MYIFNGKLLAYNSSTYYPMEGVFSLPEAIRTELINSLLHSLGCSYICLWAYDTILPNRLAFLDGFYNAINNQPSSSLGSIAQQLFSRYRILTFDVNDDCVPGLAFRNQRPYLELQQLQLLALASTEIQTQFYKEARIKTAVFMGCNKGEIELGFLNISQAEIQTALRNLFPEDFSRQTIQIDPNPNLSPNPNPPSSSSSSLRSLSTAGSPEYSSLIFNIPNTSQPHFPETLGGVPISIPVPQMRPISNTPTSSQSHQQVLQLQQQLSQITPTQSSFPTQEFEHDAIMRAIQNVISSSSSHHQQNLPYVIDQRCDHISTNTPDPIRTPQEASAFMRYRPERSSNITSQLGPNSRGLSLMKRSFAFFRSLNLIRMRERNSQATRPSSTQLHHMISERRRREKLNDNFQGLRALLPPGTKKDKASILISAKETLRSLMAEIEKLSKRNQELTSLILPTKESSTKETKASLSSNERLNVRVIQIPESSLSEDAMVDLQVNVRGQICQVHMLMRLLEFLKQVHNVRFISMNANTQTEEGNYIHQITFRLRVSQGSEWDEDAFQEAVRRVVADLMQYQLD